MGKGLLLLCLFSFSTLGYADDRDWYIGAGAGVFRTGDMIEDYSRRGLEVVESNRLKIAESVRYDFDQQVSPALDINIGYRVMPGLSFELGLFGMDSIDVVADISKEFAGGTRVEGEHEFELALAGVSASTLLDYRMSDAVSVYTRLGVAWTRQKRTFDVTEPVFVENPGEGGHHLQLQTRTTSETDRHLDVLYGLGLSLELQPRLDARFEVSGLELQDGRAFGTGVKLVYWL